MIPKWVRSLLGLEERVEYDDCALEAKTQGLRNMKRLNEFILSPDCQQTHLTELEIGAETISLNLKKQDTEKLKGGGK